jgi:hypothetical protein
MNIKIRTYAIFLLAAVATMIILFQGCGSKNSDAPDGSTITINPSSLTLKNPFLFGDVIQDYTVIARYADGTPIPDVALSISGAFGFPVVTSTGGGFNSPCYEFWSAPGGSAGGGTRVNNGFTAETDSSGTYKFSIVIYSEVTGTGGVFGPNAFTDTIQVLSGTAIGQTTITVTVGS